MYNYGTDTNKEDGSTEYSSAVTTLIFYYNAKN